MWNISESGNAMQAFPNSRSSSFSAAQVWPSLTLPSFHVIWQGLLSIDGTSFFGTRSLAQDRAHAHTFCPPKH